MILLRRIMSAFGTKRTSRPAQPTSVKRTLSGGAPYHFPNHPTISVASRSGASSEIQCDTPSSTSNRYGAVTNRSAARAATGPMNSSPVLHTYIVGTVA